MTERTDDHTYSNIGTRIHSQIDGRTDTQTNIRQTGGQKHADIYV